MFNKVIVAVWKADENSIVISCPSSKGGNYLIGVTLKNEQLIVAHDCSAIKANLDCWHVKAAVDAYCQWQWWEDIPRDYQSIRKKIVLQPEWEQIPVPGQLPQEVLSAVIANDDSSYKTA